MGHNSSFQALIFYILFCPFLYSLQYASESICFSLKSKYYWPTFLSLRNFSKTPTKLENSLKSLHIWLECSTILATKPVTFVTGFFNAKRCRKFTFVNLRALKKTNSNLRFEFERLWVRRTIWDDSVVKRSCQSLGNFLELVLRTYVKSWVLCYFMKSV